MVYTSYFGNIKRILASIPDAKFISIAGKTPSWFVGEKFLELAPHRWWWQEWHSKFIDCLDSKESVEWYTDKYNSTVLSQLSPLDTARKIKDLAKWKPAFMLCYETPEKFCHRHLVANWLMKYHIDCNEWISNES